MCSSDLEDKNLEAVLDLRRGIVLEGRVTSADGGPAVPDAYSVAMQPDPLAPGLPAPPAEQFIEFTEPGRFRIAAGPYPQTLLRDGSNRGVFIKEARYNGAPAQDLKLPLNTGATAHSLELILDDKFATVRGEVAGSGVVVFQLDGLVRGYYPAQITNGTYVTGPLPPGRYRVAVMPTDQVALELLERPFLDPNAPTITVRAGATETLNVRAQR